MMAAPAHAHVGDQPAAAAMDTFIKRHGLPPRPATLATCRGFIRTHFPSVPGDAIAESPSQGYCSLTFLAGPDCVVQFRPQAHGLDVGLAELSRAVYGGRAPLTELLGSVDFGEADTDGNTDGRSNDGEDVALLVYAMTRIPGVSLADFRRLYPAHATPFPTLGPSSSSASSLDEVRAQREALVRDFARLFAAAWEHGRAPSNLPRPKGLVGNSLRWRVEKMHAKLPVRFQPAVERVLAALPGIEEDLPWVLTHGDVVPSNIMVVLPDANSPSASRLGNDGNLRLSGLLDWAEAEYLPFGIGLYGLEELLGQTEQLWDGTGPYPPRGSRFAYYPEAEALRVVFWAELEGLVPVLRSGEGEIRMLVEAARDLGILLWHGIAFDDGRLDRVVEEGRDAEEVQRLDMFLGLAEQAARDDEGVGGVELVVGSRCEDTLNDNNEDDDDVVGQMAARPGRRRLSLSDAVKRTWAYLRHLRLPGPVLRKV